MTRAFTRLSLAAGLALLLAAGGRAASDPQNFLPDDCHMISVTRVKDMLGTAAYKSLKDTFKDILPGMGEEQLKDLMGLDAQNVVMITQAMSFGKLEELVQQFQRDPNNMPAISVVQVSKPVKAADIRAAIKGQEFTEVKVGGFTMYEAKDAAFCVADDQTVVYGPSSLLKAVLERNKPAKLSATMEKAMKELANPKAAVMVMALKDLLAKPEIEQLLQTAPLQAQQFVNDMEGLVLQVGVAEDIDVGLSLLMKSNKAADELRKIADGLLVFGKLQMGPTVPKEAVEIVNTIKLANDGSKVQASMAIKTASLSKLLKDLAKKAGLPQ